MPNKQDRICDFIENRAYDKAHLKENVMSADSMVSEALANVPKAVAAGIVDMGTGMLLAVKTTDLASPRCFGYVSSSHKRLI